MKVFSISLVMDIGQSIHHAPVIHFKFIKYKYFARAFQRIFY